MLMVILYSLNLELEELASFDLDLVTRVSHPQKKNRVVVKKG